MIRLCLLALIIALANDQIMPVVDASGSFTFVNKCDYTVWPVILSSTGSEPLSTTGFVLPQGGSKTIQGVKSWNGRFWARTQCSQDSTGKFTCLTGDCGSGKIECNGGNVNGSLTVTLAEFSLGANGSMDLYDVSLVDGYNLPLLVVPQGGSGAKCLTTGCTLNLNGGGACPSELKVTNALGDGVATSTFTCSGSPDYSITFCPSPVVEIPAGATYTAPPASASANASKQCRFDPKRRRLNVIFKNKMHLWGALQGAPKTTPFRCTCGRALKGAPSGISAPSPATSQKPFFGSPNPSPGGDGDSNSRNNNSYYLPYVNGTVGYDGATNVNSGGASTCIHVLRSQLIAVTVATTVWRLCQHF